MNKSVTLISVALTTIVLVTLAGVVYAYKGLVTPKTASVPPVSPQTVDLPLIASSPTDIPDVSPQDAASIAAKFSNRTDLYSVELADFNGAQSYKVTFSSGDIIYVTLKGQVLALVAPPPPVVVSSDPPPKQSGGNGEGNSGGRGSGGGDGGSEGEHQGGDD